MRFKVNGLYTYDERYYIYLPFREKAGLFSLPLNVKTAIVVRLKTVQLDITRWPFFSYFRHARRRRRRRDVKVYSISSKVAEIQGRDKAVIWDIPLVSRSGPDADVHLMIISTIATTPSSPIWRGKEGEGGNPLFQSVGDRDSRYPFRVSFLFVPFSSSAVHFRCNDGRSFIIITSARITQSDRSHIPSRSSRRSARES